MKANMTQVYLHRAEIHGHSLWEHHAESFTCFKAQLFKRRRTWRMLHSIREAPRLHASPLGPVIVFKTFLCKMHCLNTIYTLTDT